ncbi:MAG TPA: acyl-CoA dehydrogenase family protein [Acidimicrobiales bacterium]|nr:acyl-CoA dehydrogenase family protein [Acidimicrobiales bacterium]
MPAPFSMDEARAALGDAQSLVDACARRIAGNGGVDAHQVVAYDLAHAAAAVACARGAADYGDRGDVEARLAAAFVADAIHDVASRVTGREAAWGVEPGALDKALRLTAAGRDPEFMASLCGEEGPRHLGDDMQLVADTFRRFAEDKVRPVAEHIHRTNSDIPEDIISGLAELGTFGLSVPEQYGGWATGSDDEYVSMVVATEELSRGSLGVGGSLITRPEILTRALLKGGTEEQKAEWLPKLATGEVMNAVAVTEPDFGSDVAGVKVTAVRDGDDYVVNGVKTWCTFAARADVLMLLVRTGTPDSGHRGLSLLISPKERGDGHGFLLTQDGGGKLEGRPIDTLGYRGMHSYELAFENWLVPAANLIGLDDGLGKGFYMQMAGFENGRLQTAARAIGVMQAAYEAALDYASNRVVFGEPIVNYQLTRAKLTKMAAIIQAARQFSYHVAHLMAKGEGSMEASLVKAYVCRAAEWVTREALQIHGGMGYAEEFPVSRYFVDARVLSIFEGADETLALKVIARRLTEAAAS